GAQGAGDGEAEAHVDAGDAQVAGRRDGRAAAGARTGDGGDGRHRAALDGTEHLVHGGLVVDGVAGAGEGAELGYVGSGGEGVAGTGDDDRRQPLGRRGADLGQSPVHAERQRVARGGTVEGEITDVTLALEKQFLFGRHVNDRRSPPGTS